MKELGHLAGACTPRAAALALQEVTPGNMRALWPKLEAAGFRSPLEQPQRGRPFNGQEGYYVALTTRSPLGPLVGGRYEPYDASLMGRGLLLGRAEWAGVGPVVLGCSHFESFVGESENARVVHNRKAQLHQAAALLEREARAHGCVAALLIGDINWTDKDGDPVEHLGRGWRDAWKAAGQPQEAKATTYGWRLDRCFVLSLHAAGHTLAAGASDGASGAVCASSVALVGVRPIANEYFDKVNKRTGVSKRDRLPVSDHKGLLVTFGVPSG